MFSCDYNGWADVPEEEREGIDAFEAIKPSVVQPAAPVHLVRWKEARSWELEAGKRRAA